MHFTDEWQRFRTAMPFPGTGRSHRSASDFFACQPRMVWGPGTEHKAVQWFGGRSVQRTQRLCLVDADVGQSQPCAISLHSNHCRYGVGSFGRHNVGQRSGRASVGQGAPTHRIGLRIVGETIVVNENANTWQTGGVGRGWIN